MNRIPGKLAIRKAATKDMLLSLMVEREIGFCEEDRTAYIRIGDSLEPLGGGRLDIPTTTSLLMGFEEEAETYTYDWKSLESLEPVQSDPLRLWSRLAGMGFFAEVARRDIKGRDISENLDYASVLIAVYDATTYAVIDSAISSGKSVILSIGHYTRFAYLQSKINSGYVFRSILSENHTYVDYTVLSDDTWSFNTYDLGESSPMQGSNKLLTSGGAFTEFAKKANATNITPGTFTKVAVNEQGVVTEGSQLEGTDIPEHSADKLTSGHLDPDRLRDSSIPAEKLEIRKKLMVDGETITAVETLTAIVLNALPALRRICQGEHGEGKYWIDETTGKVMTVAPGSTEPSVAYVNLSSCLTELILDAAETAVQTITRTNCLSSSPVSVAAVYNWVCGNILQAVRDTQESDKPVTAAEQSQGYKDLVFGLGTQLYPVTSFINVVIMNHHSSDVTSPPSTGTFYKGIEVYLGNENSSALFLIRKLNTDYTALDDRGVTVGDALSSTDFAYMPMWNCTMAGFPNFTLCDRVCVRFIFDDHTTFGAEPKLSASIFATVIRDPTQFDYE